ncbi:MAG: helix-turn-helix domain-containing protein, partial [Bacteroidota bacterium]
LFQPVEDGLPDLKEVFWCKWQLQNKIQNPTVVQNWILDIGKGDYIEVYMVDSTGKITSHQIVGELMPMSQKELSQKHFVERIPISLPPNETFTMYIRLHRISGFPPQLKLELYQDDFYNRSVYESRLWWQWAFFGVLSTFIFLGVMAYGMFLHRSFLYFTLFLIGITGYLLDAFFNFYGNFIFREHPQLVMYVVYGMVTLMNISYLLFIQNYLDLATHFPAWNKCIRPFILLNVILFLVACGTYFFTMDEFQTDKIIIPFILITHVFIASIVLPIIHRKQYSFTNLAMVLATLLFFTAILINCVSIFQGNNYSLVSTQVILTSVIVIFGFALLHQFRSAQKPNIKGIAPSQEEKLIEPSSVASASFYRSNDEHSHKNDAFINQLTAYLLSNIDDKDMSVLNIQRAMLMSRTQLHRKLKERTGLSITQFVKRIRLKRAYEIVKSHEGFSTKKIAAQVGYKSIRQFLKDFESHFGFSPKDVIENNKKEITR